jgi:acetamidase/formamidase
MQTVIQLQAVHALPCLTAIEAALTEPFEFHVRSDLHLKSLRAETPGAWITMRFDEDLDAAANAALRDMIETHPQTRQCRAEPPHENRPTTPRPVGIQ